MKVSVIIPTHNRAALVVETVANALAQSLPPHEVIVVDDGSTDGTPEALHRFGSRIRYVRQENSGAAAARNRGLREASGGFIQFMDSDDLMSPNKLEAQARALEKSGADICLSPWAKVRIEGTRLRFENHVLQQAPPPACLPLAAWLVRGWSTVLQSLLVRRTLLDRAGPLDERLTTNDDIDLVWRLLAAGARIAFTNECLTLYRLHDADKLSGSPRWHRRRLEDWRALLLTMRQDAAAGRVRLDAWSRLQLWIDWQETLRHLSEAGSPALSSNPWARRGARLLRRVAELQGGLRQRRRGARWMPGYCSGPPTAAQWKLIEALGFASAE